MDSIPDSIPDLFIVADDLIFHQLLKATISVENIGRVTVETSNGFEFLELHSQIKYNPVLKDINKPHLNVIEGTQKAFELNPDLKIIALTQFENEEFANEMVAPGVTDFVLKSKGNWELEKAIKEGIKNENYFTEKAMSKTGKTDCIYITAKLPVKDKIIRNSKKYYSSIL